MKMSFEEALEYMKNGGAVKSSTWKDDSYIFINGKNFKDFIDDSGNRVFMSYEDIIAEWEPIETTKIKAGDRLVCRENNTNEKAFFYIVSTVNSFFAVDVGVGFYYYDSNLKQLERELNNQYTIVGKWSVKDLMEKK